MTAFSGTLTQAAALTARVGASAPHATQAVLLAAYGPPSAEKALTAQAALLAERTSGVGSMPGISQGVVLVAFATGVPQQSRSRSWSFVLDGHTFWVLDLGVEGTFLFDKITRQWCKFTTQGFNGQWNFANGCMWGTRIIAGDLMFPTTREMAAGQIVDEGWRDIAHVVTGGILTRSRQSIGCSVLRIAASVGIVDEISGASLSMRYSDDSGNTWSDYFTVPLTEGDFAGDVEFRALGSFSAPGRIFELSDSGGLVRIDGADAGLSNFDDDSPQSQG